MSKLPQSEIETLVRPFVLAGVNDAFQKPNTAVEWLGAVVIERIAADVVARAARGIEAHLTGRAGLPQDEIEQIAERYAVSVIETLFETGERAAKLSRVRIDYTFQHAAAQAAREIEGIVNYSDTTF